MTIAFYWRQQREKHQLSRRKLGKSIGLSHQWITLIEEGEQIPSAGLCARFATALSLDVDVVMLKAGHTPADLMLLMQAYPEEACKLLRHELLTRCNQPEK